MIVHFEIPDEFENRRLFLVSGVREVIARKHPEECWEVKIKGCNLCGECCMGLNPKTHPYPVDDEGTCSKLERNNSKRLINGQWETGGWSCKAGASTPFMCVVYPVCAQPESCSVKYRTVER